MKSKKKGGLKTQICSDNASPLPHVMDLSILAILEEICCLLVFYAAELGELLFCVQSPARFCLNAFLGKQSRGKK